MKERGFLTLNPLKFMDPVMSVAVPLVLVMLGGIPLIGGRTLIESDRLRSRWWDTPVSLAIPWWAAEWGEWGTRFRFN